MTSSWEQRLIFTGWAMIVSGLVAIPGCASNPAPIPQPVSATTAPADEDAVLHFTHETPGVPQPGQRVFASPEGAAGVFKDAVLAKDRRTLFALFGDEGRQLVFSGDRVQEDNDLQGFGQRLAEYLHVDRTSDNTAVIRIGQQNWPFPIPLVKSPDGWFFDTVAGRDELLNRHIGEDELNAIAVCRAYVQAQNEYIKKDRTGQGVAQYAQHLMSRPGARDGLYWEVGPAEELSPLGPLVAEARAEGYPTTRPGNAKPRPYHGYIFHILQAQGDAAPGGKMSYVVDDKMVKGFAMIAYPSKYGASGIMTFTVGKDGKVYQKDLGPETRQLAGEMTEYNPAPSWTEVKE
jgi:hypothetical protein